MGFKSPEQHRETEKFLNVRFRETAQKMISELRISMENKSRFRKAQQFLKDHPKRKS